jgi:hypothetical protein
MATLRRNDSRPEECSTSTFTRQDEKYLPSLHTKFGLIKIFVKVKDPNI